jgi:hypothetical protein
MVFHYFVQIIRYMFRSYDHLQATSHVNFRCIYFRLKMVVWAKYVADTLNKIVKNC